MLNDKNAYIFDVYNHDIYPGDNFASKAIKCDVNVYYGDDDESYLEKLNRKLPRIFEDFNPEFVIYNAGTDCMMNDPLGNLSITPEGIIKRD